MIPFISYSDLIFPLKKITYFIFSSAPSAKCPPGGVHGGAGPAGQPGVRGRRAAPAWGDLAQGEEARGVRRSRTHPGQRNSGHRLHPAQWRGLVHVHCQKPGRQSQPRHKAGHSGWVEGGNVHKRLRAWVNWVAEWLLNGSKQEIWQPWKSQGVKWASALATKVSFRVGCSFHKFKEN